MDSNSDSFDSMFLPKIEFDPDLSERESLKRETRLNWTSENTRKLIDILEKECKELWDIKHPFNKDRNARQTKLEYLADVFGTTSEEINRKTHNLRTQFNNELRKIKRRQATSGIEGAGGGNGSGWEYFEALSFMLRAPSEPLELDSVNLELAEFQAEEEEEFGAAARANCALATSSPGPTLPKPAMRVAASCPPPPLPLNAHPHLWPEDHVPLLRPGNNVDECQIFGDFVASELRMLRSQESRKTLKRMIQQAILRVGEEEDVNTMRSGLFQKGNIPE